MTDKKKRTPKNRSRAEDFRIDLIQKRSNGTAKMHAALCLDNQADTNSRPSCRLLKNFQPACKQATCAAACEEKNNRHLGNDAGMRILVTVCNYRTSNTPCRASSAVHGPPDCTSYDKPGGKQGVFRGDKGHCNQVGWDMVQNRCET